MRFSNDYKFIVVFKIRSFFWVRVGLRFCDKVMLLQLS